jgi:hypothetical protein
MEYNEQQQLDLISEMIKSARQEFSDDSFIYLLWGWTVCIASLTEFIMIRMGNDMHGMVWLVFIPVAIIAQIIFLVRQKKREKIRSHIDKTIGYVWMAVGISMFVILGSMNILQAMTYPVLILLYGIGTYISGSMMRLKVMQAGAICCWIISAVSFYASFEYQLLLLSLSLILSYIIPGHMLKNRFKQNV